MFELLGDKPAAAAAEAKAVMRIETDLAKASMDRVARRNPTNLDHKMTVQQLAQLAPNFDFSLFFTAVDAPRFTSLNVSNPEFFKAVNAELASVPLAEWKTYLRWHVAHSMAPVLSDAFDKENFRFYQQYLGGQKEEQARWKRCVRLTDEELGEALGQPYVDETFGVEGKTRTLQMVKAIETEMGKDLRQLPWMTETTKEQALKKLAQVENKIGYPDKWRDYSKLDIVRGDFVGDTLRAENFEFARRTRKIGKPVDKQEWGMTPPTVNAYYNPSQNNINFPAGILQPPFYDNTKDDAVNFGGAGAVIGHELTHGFDDQGSRFDGQGNLRDWWTPADEAEFRKRTECIANEYSNFVAVDDVHLNGHLTLGENTADNGGVRLALLALKDKLDGKEVPPIDGFTPEQRFFISYGQIWCQNETPQIALLRAKIDPHSPGQYRVNGVVSNMPEFEQAFHCHAGQPMVRENACHVW
jgi:predicted metalloendopeptidase